MWVGVWKRTERWGVSSVIYCPTNARIQQCNFLFALGQVLPTIHVLNNSLNGASSYWFEQYHLQKNIITNRNNILNGAHRICGERSAKLCKLEGISCLRLFIFPSIAIGHLIQPCKNLPLGGRGERIHKSFTLGSVTCLHNAVNWSD